MARNPFRSKHVLALEQKVADLENRSATFDLKSEHLLDIIKGNESTAPVSPETATKFTGVLSAVSLRSELLASFPKDIYRITKDGREPVSDPLYKILAYQPNPFMNAFTYWELVNTHLDLWGNSYSYISRYGGKVSALTPIHPRNIKIIVEGGKLIYRVTGTGDKILDGDHAPSKILHFKDISYDGIQGLSRITLASKAIDIALSAEKFGKDFFDKGGQAKGVIETDQTMNPDAMKNFAKHWNEHGNHGTPILDMGKKYKAIDIPMEDAQFIATREFQLQDIARVFRVPPHLLADLSRATYSNIEHSDIQFVKYGLRPMVKRYEQELELKLLGDNLGKKVIRFNLDGILRGDTASRAEYISKMIQAKVINRNEARALENYNPVEGGDVFENPATSSDKSTNNEQNEEAE